MSQKVFITGVNFKGKEGFIGSELARRFDLGDGDCYYARLFGDMRKTKSVVEQMAKFKPDAVVHLAGLHRIEDGENDPDKFFKNNVDGTWSVLQATLSNKVKKFVFVSSLAVAYNRRTTYAMTKLMQEEMLRTYADRMTVIILRLASVYDETRGTIGWLLNGPEPLELYGDGLQVRDFIHVYDVATALLSVLSWKRGGFTCDIGTGRGSMMVELARLAGRKYRLIQDQNPQFNPPFSVANPVPAQEILGFVPTVDYRDFIKKNRKSVISEKVE